MVKRQFLYFLGELLRRIRSLLKRTNILEFIQSLEVMTAFILYTGGRKGRPYNIYAFLRGEIIQYLRFSTP